MPSVNFCVNAENDSEWRVASGEWFWRGGTVPVVPKNLGHAGTKLEGCSLEQPNLFVSGGQCSRTAEKLRRIRRYTFQFRQPLEDRAPARPKNFGTAKTVSSKFPLSA
jgi:hypothetical protein